MKGAWMALLDILLLIGFFGGVGIALGYTILRKFDVAIVALLWSILLQGAVVPACGGRR